MAAAICLHQRHFTLSLAHPASFGVMLHHRCGQLLTATFLWAACETIVAGERRGLRLAWPAA